MPDDDTGDIPCVIIRLLCCCYLYIVDIQIVICHSLKEHQMRCVKASNRVRKGIKRSPERHKTERGRMTDRGLPEPNGISRHHKTLCGRMNNRRRLTSGRHYARRLSHGMSFLPGGRFAACRTESFYHKVDG